MALNPHQRQKVDISQMTEEEQKLFRLYGKLPPKKNVAKHNLMERKYFDSGDYALSKAGKTAPQSVGTAIPSPENIHHATHSLSLSSNNNPTCVASPTTTETVPSVLPRALPTDGADGGALNSVDHAIIAETRDGPSKGFSQPVDAANTPVDVGGALEPVPSVH